MKILIVDDMQEDRQLLRYIAERHGYEVMEAENGQEALQIASANKPDLIISDALMPVMDGFQFLRRVRADEALKSIRFIFYSASYQGELDVKLAFSLGADDFIVKPKEPKELWDEVERILQSRKEERKVGPELVEAEAEYLKCYSEVVAAQLELKIKELEEAKVQIEERERRERILHQIADIFLTAADEEMFGKVLATVLGAMESKLGMFGFLAETGDLVVPSLTGEAWSECRVFGKSYVFPPSTWGNSLWGRAIREKKSVASNGPFHTPSGHILLNNLLGVPIIFGDETIGLIATGNKEGVYSEKDQALLETVAGSIAPILAARLQRDRQELQRRQAEASLRESESFIRKILETVDEGFIVVDRNYRILSANKAYCLQSGLSPEEIVGRLCYEISHYRDGPCYAEGETCAVRHTFETGAPHIVSHTHRDRSGATKYVEIRSYPITDDSGTLVSAIETISDVTERKKLEEQLRHAQKLEALGTLAGGVAHDFNNILSIMVGYSTLMEMGMAEDDPILPYLREIRSATDRAAHLTQALLIFGRKQIAELRPLDINELVNGMKKMVLRLIGEDIDTTVHCCPGKLMVMGDYGQLEQVLMNFATNARDAMPDGGSLTLETKQMEIEEEFLHRHRFGKSGRVAVISVSDTGQGMDEPTRERIFEPFFTTKGVGKGTGLGLSIVYGIVQQHNGYIHCFSEPGKGTTFQVYLPMLREEWIETEEAAPASLPSGTETILMADDDGPIRKMNRDLLERYGYTVIEAQDGTDTVYKFLENKDRIALVLLDVIMPKKSGKEAYEEIRRINPGVKTLFISGYTDDVIQRKRIAEEHLVLLQKPVSPSELLVKIREMIDRK